MIINFKELRAKMGEWSPALLIGGFFLLTACIAAGFWLAFKNYRGLDIDNQMKKHWASGRIMEKMRLQDGLGIGSELLIDKKPDGPAKIRFMLRDKDNRPITGAKALMILTARASGKKVEAPLDMDEPGVYRGFIDMPEGGMWDARIAITTGKDSYQVTKSIELP